jgi:hypothetical protein
MSNDLRRNFAGRFVKLSCLAGAAAARGRAAAKNVPRSVPGGLGDLRVAQAGRNQRALSPALAKVGDRLPISGAESNRRFWKTY